MSEFETFGEWVKRRAGHEGHRPVPVKNANIDSFLSAVDNLKRDMDELDALEKKEKSKPKKTKPDDKVKQKDKDKKPSDDKAPKKKDKDDDLDDAEDVDVLDDADLDRPGKPVRLLPDRKVQGKPPVLRGKPNRPVDPRKRQLEDDDLPDL